MNCPNVSPLFCPCAQTGCKRKDRSTVLSYSLSFLKRGAGLMPGGGGSRVTRGATDGTLKALWGGRSATMCQQQQQEELSLLPKQDGYGFPPLTRLLSSVAGSTWRPQHQQHATSGSRKARLRSDTARPQRSFNSNSRGFSIGETKTNKT